MATPDGEIQSAICEYLTLRRHFFYRSNNTPVYDPTRKTFRSLPKYTPKGLPDITLIKDGRYVGLEVKTPKGTVSEDQRALWNAIVLAGGEYHIVRSVDDVVALGL